MLSDVIARGQRPRGIEQPAPRPVDEQVVQVSGLTKTFKRASGAIVTAVDDVSMTVARGEFVVLLGPSGCGKTTLLRCIAGLERPDEGLVRVADRTVYSSAERINLPPERRRIGMMFQSYALWPHMTVFDNVAYPLRVRKVRRAEIAQRVSEMLALVGVGDLARQHPAQMSGGQQQRVALARALVANDQLVLFDEPLSNVDAKVRQQLRLELLAMQRDLSFSAVYVTHDQAEAMELGHRIAVMHAGKPAQIGTPAQIYESPASRYVANFIGTTNEIDVRLVEPLEAGQIGVVEGPWGPLRAIAGTAMPEGVRATAMFRPERCTIGSPAPGENSLRGHLEATLYLGSHTEQIVRIGGQVIRVWSTKRVDVPVGAAVEVSVDAADLRVVADDRVALESSGEEA